MGGGGSFQQIPNPEGYNPFTITNTDYNEQFNQGEYFEVEVKITDDGNIYTSETDIVLINQIETNPESTAVIIEAISEGGQIEFVWENPDVEIDSMTIALFNHGSRLPADRTAVVVPVDTTQHTFLGLENNKKYDFEVYILTPTRMQYYSLSYVGVPGLIVPVNLPNPDPHQNPNPPTIFEIIPEYKKLQVIWGEDDKVPEVFETMTIFAIDPNGVETSISNRSGTSSYIFNLEIGVEYEVYISGLHDGVWYNSESVLATTIPSNFPDSPTNIRGTPGDSQVTLIWDAPEYTGSSSIKQYFVVVKDEDGYVNYDLEPSGDITGTGVTVIGLENGIKHQFIIQAMNEDEYLSEVSYSEWITPVAVPDNDPTITITNIVRGDQTISFDWGISFDIDDVEQLEIYWQEVENPETLKLQIINSNFPTEYVIEDLADNSEYEIKIDMKLDNYDDIITSGWYFAPVDVIVDAPLPPTIPETKKNDGSCSDCIPPTLGLDKQFKRIVDDGFSYNNHKVDVDFWHTIYPLINTTVGEPNTVKILAYEDRGYQNMKWVQFGIGMPFIGSPLNNAEVLITVNLNGDVVESVDVIDKDNLIEFTDVSTDVIKCVLEITAPDCLEVTLQYTFREAPLNHVMVIQPMDKSKNAQSFYFNDGLQVIGKSLNPPDTLLTLGKLFTQTDRINEIWIDEDQIEYEKNSFDTFKRITPYPPLECNDKPLDQIMNGGDRNNCHWRAEKMNWYWNY